MCFSVQVDRDLPKLAKIFNAKIAQNRFDQVIQKSKEKPKAYKWVGEDERIYSKYYAPIIIHENHERVLTPMRYQLLPSFCQEDRYTRINPKTGKPMEIKNTFNARLDSLENAKAWQGVFMEKHALLPIKGFFEWVPKDDKTAQIKFFQSENQYTYVPCLWDRWISPERDRKIESFAIITTDPNPEVLEKGHDRSPISIDGELIDEWLSTGEVDEAYSILTNQKKIRYENEWV